MMSKSSDWALREEEKRNGDDGYDEYLAELEIANAELEYDRERAEKHIQNVWVEEVNLELESVGLTWKEKEQVDLTTFSSSRFFNAIWHASTEILPALEVQVVIDGENNCYVTTGSSGYVEFGMKPPVGMKLPIKCWIHTHPFGSAYFSGTDISTVSIWERRMEEAFVLGGSEYTHYGHWQQGEPKQLAIYRNGELERMQYWGVKNEEE
jgi:hypothetical protein